MKFHLSLSSDDFDVCGYYNYKKIVRNDELASSYRSFVTEFCKKLNINPLLALVRMNVQTHLLCQKYLPSVTK